MIKIIGVIILGLCCIAWFSGAILLRVYEEELIAVYGNEPPEWLLLSLLILAFITIMSFVMGLIGD